MTTLLVATPSAMRAQDGPPAWIVETSASVIGFTESGSSWTEWLRYGTGITRQFERASVTLEGSRWRRYSHWDTAVRTDVWFDLWSGGYGNLQVRYSQDPEVLPDVSTYAEVYQGMPGNWEVSGSYGYSRLNQQEHDVVTFGFSLARYLGNWYLRQRTTFAYAHGEDYDVFFGGTARYYFGSSESFLELGAAAGEGVEFIGRNQEVAIRGRKDGYVRLEAWPWPHAGIGLEGQVGSFDGFPTRRGVGVQLRTRW
jgi:YaiO family outer membrane protein